VPPSLLDTPAASATRWSAVIRFCSYAALNKHHYRPHEFGDFMLIERQFHR
jgi:hypothetical protein